ncbi:MAG: PulJ/GspJ family protein [Gammaproteobacteria bacterium]
MEERGFSFIEVLVTLILITSISLALLKQQWQISRIRMQIQQQNLSFLQKHNHKEQGVSILECLIGMTIALTILTVFMQQYVQIKQQTELSRQNMQQFSRMQIVLQILENSGHQAGFTPCGPLAQLQTFDHRNGQILRALNLEKVESFKLTLQRMVHFIPVLNHSESNSFTLLDQWRPRVHTPLIISDCQHAEVLDGYQIRFNTIQFFQNLKFKYHQPIYLGEWLAESFWTKTNLSGKPALFYQMHHQAEELWTDAPKMQAYVENKQPYPLLHINLDVATDRPISYLIRLYHV